MPAKGFSRNATVIFSKARDAWTVWFNRRLLAVIWMGNKDGSELTLDDSILTTIWTDFISRASKLSRYEQLATGAPQRPAVSAAHEY